MKKLLVLAVLLLTLTLSGCVSTKIGVKGTITDIQYEETCFMKIFCDVKKVYTISYNGKEYVKKENLISVHFEVGEDYMIFLPEDEVAD